MVSVAIPVLNGGADLQRTLAAVRAQRLGAGDALELVVCDSGSSDGSVALAHRFGAEVIEIPQASFSHGATRNLLMERSHGEHVAFLTQDAVPAGSDWLARLLDAFTLADDIGLAFGPYRPLPDASPMVARELSEWFAGFAPDGRPRLDRLSDADRGVSSRELLGPRAFFTDANGCVSRAAWRRVPFRAVPYAEDHVLALDMLRAGYAKVFVPQAAVVHSHEYSPVGWLRRAFDEARALREVYGYAPALSPRELALNVWGRVGADWRWAAGHGGRRSPRLLAASTVHHTMRSAGGLLGARSGALPAAVVRRLSLEGRE